MNTEKLMTIIKEIFDSILSLAIIGALIFIVFFSGTVATHYVLDKLSNSKEALREVELDAYERGLATGALLDKKPNVCLLEDGGYYQITFKEGKPYLATKTLQPIPLDIMEHFDETQSYYYGTDFQTSQGKYHMLVHINYGVKRCGISTSAMCKDDRYCDLKEHKEGVVTDKLPAIKKTK